MLLVYGNTKVSPNWVVTEKTAPGYCRMYFVYSGEVTYRDETVTVQLEKNCFYIFPSSAPYEMTQNPQKQICCTFFHMDIKPFVLQNIVKFELSGNPMLRHLLQSSSYAIGQKNIFAVDRICETIYQLLKDNGVFSTPKEEILKLINYICEHWSEKLTLGELSEYSGYNPQYLIRVFKKEMGFTPYQYVISIKMKKAAMLLSQGNTVSEVAEKTGYDDIKMFSRAFKKHYNVTPSKINKLCIIP